MIQLPIPLHQQDNQNFCGPATAQMILAPIVGALVDQGVIELTMSASTAPELCKLGLTSPKQLEWGLNATQKSHGGMKHEFSASCFLNQPDGKAATAAIVQTLRTGTGAAALIMDGGHWVAVTGAALPPGEPQGVHPEALTVNNPSPPLRIHIPHHTATDGCGGVAGGRVEHVSVPFGWYAKPYFTPAEKCRHQPKLYNAFVIVGAAGRAPTPGPPTAAKENLAGDGHDDDPAAAVAHAIARYGLAGPEFDEARFDKPRIVRYLGDDPDSYYLVPLRWPDGSVLIGRTGVRRTTYLGAQLRPPKELRTDTHYRLAEPSEVEGWISRDRMRFGGHGDGDGGYHVLAELGWRPCMESRSPYYPFYQVMLKGEMVGYIDLNGTPYSELTDLVGG